MMCMDGLYILYVCMYSVCVYRDHGNLACTMSGHNSWVLSVAFSPDNQHIITGYGYSVHILALVYCMYT